MEPVSPLPEPPKKRRFPRIRVSRKWFVLALVLIVIAVGYLAYADYKKSKIEPVVINDQCSNVRNAKLLTKHVSSGLSTALARICNRSKLSAFQPPLAAK